MPKVFSKAERVHQCFHGPAAHAGGDFTAQQPGRGTGDEELNLFHVQQPARKRFPPRHVLNLIEEEYHPPLVSPLRVEPVILLDDQVEICRAHACQTLIFEAEGEQPFARRALSQKVRQQLPQKRRFPRAAHAVTATALPRTPGSRTSRRVNDGIGRASESTIFCRIKSRICPPGKDKLY